MDTCTKTYRDFEKIVDKQVCINILNFAKKK